MRNEFTAVVERDGRWHIAYCPEILGILATATREKVVVG